MIKNEQRFSFFLSSSLTARLKDFFPGMMSLQVCCICILYHLIHSIINVCQRSSYPFYKVSYYIKWVTTSWTYSIPLSICHLDLRTWLMLVRARRAPCLDRGDENRACSGGATISSEPPNLILFQAS